MDLAKVRVRELTKNTLSASLPLEARLVVKVNDILYQNMSLTQGAKQNSMCKSVLNVFSFLNKTMRNES